MITAEQVEEQLRHAQAQKKETAHTNSADLLDVWGYLSHYDINVVKTKPHGSATLYCLDYCLFDPAHNGNEASIGQASDGTLFYQCFHNSCKGVRTWAEARALISGSDSLLQFMPDGGRQSFVSPKQVPKPNRATAINQLQPKVGEMVNLVRATDITPEPINWLWVGWLAIGKIHILAGIAGHGKSTILFVFAATISIGGRWPDGTRAATGDVVIWSGEDDPADTIIPRLIASGADLNRIHIVKGVTTDGEKRSFDPATDIPLLRQAMDGKEVKLLIVDPIVSAVAGDSHKNAEVRRSLQPLVDLAAETGCAVYGVTHFTKGTAGKEPVERVTSSLAFGALTRMVTVAMKLPDNGEHPKSARLFARAKSNIGPDGGGFYYFIEVGPVPGHPDIENTSVLWGSAVNGTAKEMLAKAELPGEDQTLTDDAMMWLKDALSDGPVEAAGVLKAGKDIGYSKTTLHRAKSRLGIKSTKVGFAKGWGWFLPEVNTKKHVEGPIQPGVESSGAKSTQVTDYVEGSTKGPHGQKVGGVGIFAGPEDSKGVEPSDGPTIDAALGGVQPPKIPCPRVWGSSGPVGIFDQEDEIVI